MEEDQDSIIATFKPPSLVALSSSVPPPTRRLSSCFSQVATPVKPARSLASVSLQPRNVDADEDTSRRAIVIGLGTNEDVAWEIFTPIHRILVVGVVAVAAFNYFKNREICQLKKSVQLRDQALASMKQKLDYLCKQVNNFKDQPEAATDRFASLMCEQHRRKSYESMANVNLTTKVHEVPEERRMSDLSDWNSSAASSLNVQLDLEQDVYNLQQEREEKDTTIKELSTLLHASADFRLKRIAELEEVIRRQNIIINKFRKDILVLEQKVVSLTRIGRPSYKKAQSIKRPLPFMTENVVYDLDISTSSSSSDTDPQPEHRCKSAAATVSAHSIIPNGQPALKKEQNLKEVKLSSAVSKQAGQNQNNKSSRPVNPLKGMSLNQTTKSASTMNSKHTPSAIGDPKSRRRHLVGSKSAVAPKRWV